MMVDSSPKYSGEPTAQALANGLATLGRYGDNYMVHAAEGETIVPKEILDANPGLKDNLFRQMKMMGIENPDRYVVGSDLNSINPTTGQPEFFFKKIFKAVKKVFKKVLPVAAPIIGNLIAPGIGGIIASGLATKLSGGSFGDALKSSALTFGTQALAQGLFGKGTFTQGLTAGVRAPLQAAGNLFSGSAANPLAQGIFGPGQIADLGFGFSDMRGAGQTARVPQGMGSLFRAYDPTGTVGTPTTVGEGTRSLANNPNEYSGLGPRGEGMGGSGPSGGEVNTQASAPTTASAQASAQVSEAASDASKPFLERSTLGIPNPALLATGALLVGSGAFDSEPELPPDQIAALTDPERAAYRRWLTIPDKTSPEAKELAAQFGRRASYTPSRLAGITNITVPQAQQFYSTYAAGGGEVVGPGTGTSDSIPARLSDGEFVMTARAVRNAGEGNRDLGAARMYDMMNRFERGMA